MQWVLRTEECDHLADIAWGAFDNLESSSVSAGVNLAYWDHILSRDHKYQRPNDLFFQRTGKQFKEL